MMYYKFKEIVEENASRFDFICPCCKKSCWIGDKELLKVQTSTDVVGYEQHGNSSRTTYRTTYHNFRICKECNAKIISNANTGAKIGLVIACLFIVGYCLCYWLIPFDFGIFDHIQERNIGAFVGWLIAVILIAFLVIFPITISIVGKLAPSNTMTLEEAIRANAVE